LISRFSAADPLSEQVMRSALDQPGYLADVGLLGEYDLIDQRPGPLGGITDGTTVADTAGRLVGTRDLRAQKERTDDSHEEQRGGSESDLAHHFGEETPVAGMSGTR